MRRGKLKALILSISVLILLIMVYIYTGSGSATKEKEVNESAETVSFFQKVESFSSEIISRNSEKHRLKQEKKKEKEQARELLLHQTQDGEEATKTEDTTDTVEESPFSHSWENYVAPYEITVPDDMKIPGKVREFVFRSINDYVYAYDSVRLYKEPECDGEAVRVASVWEEFLRTGISEECCYQLVSKDGELLYADGTHFRRHREDMPLTEFVSMPLERVELSVEYISQFPTLTNGAEITALATVLSYLSFDITKDELDAGYLPKGKAGYTNFYDAYIGEPSSRNNSYGCYAGAIVTAANAYLSDKESELKAVDYTGISFTDVLKKVKEGSPVIVWVTQDESRDPVFTVDWIVDGEYIAWKDNMHCVVVIGYDMNSNVVIVSDPMYGIKEYELNLFVERFKEFYSQAVVIE